MNTHEILIYFRSNYNRIVVGYILTDDKKHFVKINNQRLKIVQSFCSDGGYELFKTAVNNIESENISIHHWKILETNWNNILGCKVRKIDINCNQSNFNKLYSKL